MSQKYEKLKNLLKELFQLDQPDLDFGIYRIMHARSTEITQFLDKDLLPQVKNSFAAYQPSDKATLQKELDKMIASLTEAGIDPEISPKVKELHDKIANDAVDLNALESEVYDNLYSFFRRYYSEGDFISKRVYKEGVYAIPYEGEEVKLHWANADQYYIKTSEYLRDYAFRPKPGDDITANQMRVHFRLVDVAEGEHGNVKASEDKDRVFILAGDDFIVEENNELIIKFEYRPAVVADWPIGQREGKSKSPAQKELISIAEKRILGVVDITLTKWITELGKKHIKADGEQADYTKLTAHLNRYTARNTFDYFIHKDLGKFLNLELDFYIKNEVMHLDDIESETAPKVEQYLSKIKVIRKIAKKIIDFLAQLEDFQKKLWLKKKFVVETNYCITLDRVPEEFYAEIAANDLQREEWVKLFTIDEIQPVNADLLKCITPGYSKPLTGGFLKANDKLVLDTKFFTDDFKARLISSIENFDEQMDGLLIHSENFQALNLLQARYREQVKCVYIDPPYNTGSDGFAYKDAYQHSSWNTMMANLSNLTKTLITLSGAITTSIDEIELNYLKEILNNYFSFINLITVKTKVAGVSGSHLGKSLRNTTEYVLLFSNSANDFKLTEIVYDLQRLTEFIQEMKDDGKSWKYTTVMDNVDKGEYVKSIVDGKGNEIKIYKHKLFTFKSVQQVANEKYNGDVNAVYENQYQNIFRTTNAQSSIRQRVLDETQDITSELLSITYVPSKGRNAGKEIRQYYKDDIRNLVAFLSDVVVEQNGIVYKTIKSGNLWSDILYNNIANEGGVSFNNGKKPLSLLIKIINMIIDMEESNPYILDFFAGSGTTGHAVINLNREDQGNRKYILVEMGDYFDTILNPRIQQVIYSSEWKDGKPTKRESGISHCFKYLRLESYEDTLNNLDLRRTDKQQGVLELTEAQGADNLKEQYILRYMLDIESRDSASLLNIDAFIDPTSYTLKVKISGSDESREVKVDLLETFNYLIGLQVSNIAAPHILTAEFERDSEKRLHIKDRIKTVTTSNAAEVSWWFRTVTGTTLDDKKVLVIWRNRPGGDTPEDLEKDNLVLDAWFTKQGYSSRDSEFDLIYVNGTNNLENLKTPDDSWKVRLIEQDFKQLMFEDAGI
ncbi:MAG: site-specific DNA-methyltransferase [bacterium]